MSPLPTPLYLSLTFNQPKLLAALRILDAPISHRQGTLETFYSHPTFTDSYIYSSPPKSAQKPSLVIHIPLLSSKAPYCLLTIFPMVG